MPSAPEIRIDQLSGLRTILAPGRAERPDNFSAPTVEPKKGPESCPFCEGHEDRTPPERYAVRPGGGPPDSPGWLTRVVPNLYPALGDPSGGSDSTGDAQRPGAGMGTGAEAGAFASSGDPLLASRKAGEPDLFAALPASGDHEVIVNSPRHVTAMAELDEEQFAAAIATWRERMRAHPDASYVQVIVNEGGGAGASLEHTHAQLYALPFVPAAVARERERAGAYAERTAGSGLLGDILVEEVRRGERLVAIDDEAALVCPWASRSPFELRVIPRRAAARFEDDESGAAMIRTAMRVLAARFDGPPELNLWIRTAPHGAEEFGWHVDIAPRLTIKAGFELGTGVDINIYPPERAASDLRETLST
ncbi:MAG: UDPglucose--hexose-phosphate uridylyltransferase [Solirubrobacterales bacterium]|nr:UDPglucose--hexose-phosphate uridylyltransferase [Solirubrobacterales bacterium]